MVEAQKQRVAFIGTGIMGRAMCHRLIDAGFAVTVWNRTKEKTRELAQIGAEVADTPADAASGANVVIVMLSSGPVVAEVMFDFEDGALANGLDAEAIVVVMSSIPVETATRQAERLAESRIAYVDAPVSGGEAGAIAGSLTIMAGGDEEIVDRVTPVLEVLGRVTRVGPAGCGQLAKLANQTIVGISIAAVSEALMLAEAGGADLKRLVAALQGGFADSTILRQHGDRMLQARFEPGAKSTTQLKDLATSRNLAESLGLALPTLGLVESLYNEMCREGWGDKDHSALFAYLKDGQTH